MLSVDLGREAAPARGGGMSVGVFLFPFAGGDLGQADPARLADLLRPHLETDERGFTRLRFEDGGAQLFGTERLETGFSVNHADGLEVWDFLVDVARALDLAIVTPDCPVAVCRPELLDDIPSELREGAVVVTSGAELIASHQAQP